MKNDFNAIAPYYDLLASIVFGRQLEKAQTTFLDQIKPESYVLIVGGGTGKVIEWLPNNHNLHIDYVELSEKMLLKAKKRDTKGNEFEFICSDAMEVQGNYDLIIANFFLDCFSEKGIVGVLDHLKKVLKPEGKLLVTDFYPTESSSQKLLIRLMHIFFRTFSKLQASRLMNIHEEIKKSAFETKEIQFFREGTIFSAVYEKLSH